MKQLILLLLLAGSQYFSNAQTSRVITPGNGGPGKGGGNNPINQIICVQTGDYQDRTCRVITWSCKFNIQLPNGNIIWVTRNYSYRTCFLEPTGWERPANPNNQGPFPIKLGITTELLIEATPELTASDISYIKAQVKTTTLSISQDVTFLNEIGEATAILKQGDYTVVGDKLFAELSFM